MAHSIEPEADLHSPSRGFAERSVGDVSPERAKAKGEKKIKRLSLRWLHDSFLRTPKKKAEAAMASRDGHRHWPLPAAGAASANGHGDRHCMDTNRMIT